LCGGENHQGCGLWHGDPAKRYCQYCYHVLNKPLKK